MSEYTYEGGLLFEQSSPEILFEELPPETKQWAESLPWDQRRHLLLLCHLICVSPPEVQAEFLDNYTADGLVSRKLQDRDTQERVKNFLKKFVIQTDLNELVLRGYIKQFYIHSARDVRHQPELYFQLVFHLVLSIEEQNNILNYILGFEILKMMFQMSWLQHERLYQLQKNQDEFINLYIKPIQNTHRINGIVVPESKKSFFSKRDYFVKKPEIKSKKLIELIMATFTTEMAMDLGFSIIRDPNFLVFDYDYIFQPEPEWIFSD
ncbi:MAG: hypothetical protein Fur006_35660 [Coleofasciculaceae cyanobacterium]